MVSASQFTFPLKRPSFQRRGGPDFARPRQIPKLRQNVLALPGVEAVQLLFELLNGAFHGENHSSFRPEKGRQKG